MATNLSSIVKAKITRRKRVLVDAAKFESEIDSAEFDLLIPLIHRINFNVKEKRKQEQKVS